MLLRFSSNAIKPSAIPVVTGHINSQQTFHIRSGIAGGTARARHDAARSVSGIQQTAAGGGKDVGKKHSYSKRGDVAAITTGDWK